MAVPSQPTATGTPLCHWGCIPAPARSKMGSGMNNPSLHSPVHPPLTDTHYMPSPALMMMLVAVTAMEEEGAEKVVG